jgi:reactive chlorine resistance protein C
MYRSANSATTRHATADPAQPATTEGHVTVAGRWLLRYALVVVVAWIGALKYGSYEATAIQPLIAHSPLLSWLYDIFSVRTLAALLGTAEIAAAVLIAIRPLWPRISALGSAMAVLLFLCTLSFLFSTPGVTAAGGFPVLSVLPGQFLLKDLVLIGASVWTLGDSLDAAWQKARLGGRKTMRSQRGTADTGGGG